MEGAKNRNASLNKLKVAVVDVYITTYRVPLYEKLSELYDVTYLLIREKKVKDYKIDRHARLRCKSLPFIKLHLYGFAWRIIPELLYRDYDLVIANDPHLIETNIAFWIAKLKRKKFILYSETWDWPRHPKSIVMKPFIWLLHRYANACIVEGSKAKEYIFRHGRPRRKNNVFFAHPMNLLYKAENIKQNREELYKKTGNLDGKKIILFLNRIVSYKGLDYLVKAFARLENELDVYLLIGGRADKRREVRYKDYIDKVYKLVEKLSIKNIHFLGYVEEEKKGFYLSLADVVVHPGTFRDYDAEGWGVVINEAMMFGKPVVSTDAVGAAHDLIINNINGFMVRHGDVNALYYAIKKILSDEKLAEDMGKNAKKIYKEKMDYDKMVQGYVNAIKSCY